MNTANDRRTTWRAAEQVAAYHLGPAVEVTVLRFGQPDHQAFAGQLGRGERVRWNGQRWRVARSSAARGAILVELDW